MIANKPGSYIFRYSLIQIYVLAFQNDTELDDKAPLNQKKILEHNNIGVQI